MRNWLSTISTIILISLLCSCTNESDPIAEAELPISDSAQEIRGETQGTTYQIIAGDSLLLVTKREIDSVLRDFDLELNTYIDNSIVSKFNNNEVTTIDFGEYPFFGKCFNYSLGVYSQSEGHFDPSVYPLMKQWGFMKDVSKKVSQNSIDSVMFNVSFEPGVHYSLEKNILTKFSTGFKLDFNAIAQGYSVDVLKEFLEHKGQMNFYIEIGGELYCKGHNNDGNTWLIGVDNPTEDNDGVNTRKLENAIYIQDKSLATSGNYRKFYEIEGRKYSHTINPKTGYPVTHHLLSATVVMDECSLADAYATSFMVMGLEKTKIFLTTHPELNIEVYLLYENELGRIERYVSPSLIDALLN